MSCISIRSMSVSVGSRQSLNTDSDFLKFGGISALAFGF